MRERKPRTQPCLWRKEKGKRVGGTLDKGKKVTLQLRQKPPVKGEKGRRMKKGDFILILGKGGKEGTNIPERKGKKRFLQHFYARVWGKGEKRKGKSFGDN